MRVLHILEATAGGTARHAVQLLLGLAREGVENHLAYSPLRADAFMLGALGALREAGVSLVEVPMRRSPHPSDLRAWATLVGYVRRQGPFDIFHGHSSKGGAFARLLKLTFPRARVIYNPHAFVTLSPYLRPAERWLYTVAEKMLARLTDGFILGSAYERREFDRLGFSKASFKIIPPIGLSPQPELATTRESLRRSWGLEGDEVVFGFVGRLDFQKAPHVALKAFAEFARQFEGKAKLVLVGDGPLRQSLEAMAKDLKIEHATLFLGYQDGKVAMQGFDVFVLSSAYESAGIVLLEAAASGLPILTTPVGWAPEIVGHGVNGFLYPVDDFASLSHYMALLALDEALRRKMGEEGRRRASDYTEDKMVRETLAFYREVK
ncbi:glycosyltransferase [Thermus amyloliquefaciens]|uniref:glycosyltransferase n=1 Tax=Thermus amyloliquefaciens TaxID=1449080 RepID=UPI00056E685E|nr:glycosyltransferase [Thermus amyloliquefaciens]